MGVFDRCQRYQAIEQTFCRGEGEAIRGSFWTHPETEQVPKWARSLFFYVTAEVMQPFCFFPTWDSETAVNTVQLQPHPPQY